MNSFSNKKKVKTRKSFFERFRTKKLFKKVMDHYTGQDFIYNAWTGEIKHGVYELSPGSLDLDQMYIMGNYVCSNGIPLYDFRKELFQTSWDKSHDKH